MSSYGVDSLHGDLLSDDGEMGFGQVTGASTTSIQERESLLGPRRNTVDAARIPIVSTTSGFGQRRRFRPLPTIPINVVLVIIFVTYNVFQWVNIVPNDAESSLFNLLVGLHVPVFVVTFAAGRLVGWFHNRARRDGYLKFYLATNGVREVPFVVTTLFNAFFLVVYCVWPGKTEYGFVSHFTILRVLAGVELIAVVVSVVILGRRTFRFNRARPLPDVYADDGPLGVQSNSTFDGGVDLQASATDRLTRQAEVIAHLEQQRADISKQLLAAKEQLQHEKSTRGALLRGNAQDLLARRERQIRHLVAERDTALQTMKEREVEHAAQLAALRPSLDESE